MQSMTGFGRAEAEIGGSQLIVEIKSVNHRYLDTRFRMPTFLTSMELSFSQKLRETFQRGSFDCSFRHKLLGTQASALTGTRYVVDELAARSLKDSVDWANQHLNIPCALTLEAMVQAGRVFVPVENTEALDERHPEILSLFSRAVESLQQTRLNEGERIRGMLEKDLQNLENVSAQLKQAAPKQPPHIRTELEKRIANWGLTQEVDPNRLETELAFFADRADFTEEMDRLGAHVKEFRELLLSNEPVGRKLDFYTQELHRELNTMGSKTQLTEITRLVVQGKSSVEKLRQQVQNVE